MSKPLGVPPALPVNAPSNGLAAMEDVAAKSGKAQKGVLPCKKKSWFKLDVILVNDANEETALTDLTIDFKFTDLGEVQKTTVKGVRARNLEPGGNAKVVRMSHDSCVYEAIGEFS